MVQRQQGRGIGSNQYRERVVAVDEEARKAAREGVGRVTVPTPNSSAQNSRHGMGTVAEAAQNHRTASDDHLAFALNAPAEMPVSEHTQRLRAGVERVSAAEDDVLSRHPNMYGHALVSANTFLVRAKHDPRLAEAIGDGDEDANRVLNACDRLLNDVDEQDLDVEGISQAISDLEGGGEWSAMKVDEKDSSDPAAQNDLALCRRAAALSVASSRSSSPEERDAVRKEMNKTNESLRASRLSRLGG